MKVVYFFYRGSGFFCCFRFAGKNYTRQCKYRKENNSWFIRFRRRSWLVADNSNIGNACELY